MASVTIRPVHLPDDRTPLLALDRSFTTTLIYRVARTAGSFALEKIARAVTMLIEAIGEDPQREGLRETPRRIAEMYEELFEGLSRDPREPLQVGFEEDHQEMIILRDIPFHSMCEHHFLLYV